MQANNLDEWKYQLKEIKSRALGLNKTEWFVVLLVSFFLLVLSFWFNLVSEIKIELGLLLMLALSQSGAD